MKLIGRFIVSLFLLGLITGCSSPEEKAAEFVANAKVLFTENNLEKAAIEYKNALQINQNLPDAWYGLAKIHERKQEWKQAYATLIKIRDTNPNHVNGRIMLTQLLLASNQMDQALNDANEILELAPDDARVHSVMAAVQYRLGNLEAAQQSVEKALALDPASNEAVLVKARVLISEKKYDEALVVIDAALEATSDEASLYLMKIQAYTELDDKAAIEGVYKSLVQNFPDNIAFKQALVRQYVQTGNIDEAEQLLTQIVEDNSENVEAKLTLVRFKNQYRSVDDSIALLKTYIEQDQNGYQFRFALGELYLRARNTDEAIALYQGIISDDGIQPSGLEARNKLALLYLRSGNRDEALKLVSEVLENDSNNENGLVLQAGFQIAERNYDDAIVGLRTVLRDNPNSVRALALLGQAYTATGSAELALESYGKAFSIRPGNPVAANAYARVLMRGNNPQQADEVLKQTIEAGNRSVEVLKLLTQVKLMLGEWDQAEQLAQNLKAVEGEEALSEQVLGLVYEGRQEPDQSIDAFKRAHALSPDASQPVVSVVQAYVRNNQVDEARAFLQSIIAENKDNVTATLLLGQLSLRENDTPAAIKYFERAIEINPGFEPGYRSLVAVYFRENRLNDAETILGAGLLEMPGNVTLSINLASVYEGRKEFERAIDLYEELLQTNPDLIVAKNNLASMLTDHRQDPASHDRARQISVKFRDSSVPQFRDTYAWASVVAGTNLEEAVVILEGIVKDNEQVGVYTYHLGEAYRRNGDSENAITYLNKAAELSAPNSDTANKVKQSLQLIQQ